MKIEAKHLSEFIKKVGINYGGESFVLQECILNFQETGLVVEAIDEMNTTMITGVLNKSAFTSYEPIGKIGLNNLNKVKKMIDRYSGELTFNKKDNLLVFSNGKREFDFVLPHIDSIKEPAQKPDLNYTVNFELKSDFFGDVTKNADIIEKGLSVKFRGSEKKLIAECGSDDKAREILEVPEMTEEVNVTFGPPLRQVASVLDGTINVSLKTAYPVKLLSKNELMSFTYVVAPMEANE